MREKVGDSQPSMDGGINETSTEALLAPNQLRRALNARLTEFGAVTKRAGLQRTAAAISANSVQNGFTWRQDGGTNQIMVVVNGTLYTSVYGTFPWTWTSRTGSLSTSEVPSFAQFRDTGGNDVVYIADGGLLNKWNGTTLTTNIASTATSKTIAVHNQRLWSCGDPAYPDSIFYSALNDGDTLGVTASGGGQIIVRTFGDEEIVGLASINTSLLIFHDRGISRLTGYGQDDITVAPTGVTADVGTIAPNAIVPYDNTAYFITERGLYRCNEAEVAPVATAQTPDPLLPIIRSLSSAQFAQVRAVLNRGTKELWVTMPNFGCYVYNTVLGTWSGPWDTGWVSPDTTAMFETLNTAGLPVILRGDASGYVSLCDATNVYVDNLNADGTGGERYTMTVQFHRLYCNDDSLAKTLRWGYLTASLKGSDQSRVEWTTGEDFGSWSLPPSTDQTWGASGTTWGEGTWGGSGSQSYRIPMGGNGYYVDVSVIDSGEALPVFSRFQLEAFALGRR